MELTIAFFAGIGIMSILATIGLLLADTKSDWYAFLCGPAFWICFIVCLIVHGITHWKRYHSKRSLLLDENDKLWVVPLWATEAYQEVKGWEFPSKYSKNKNNQKIANLLQNCKDKWDKEDININLVSMRYAPKSIWLDFPRVPRQEAKKILKEYRAIVAAENERVMNDIYER